MANLPTATEDVGNGAWVSRPFRRVGTDLRRGDRAGRGERMVELLHGERSEDGISTSSSMRNSNRVREQLGEDEVERILNRLTTPTSSPSSSPTQSQGSAMENDAATLQPFLLDAGSSSAQSSPFHSVSDSTPPKKKRRVCSRSTSSHYTPYFRYIGKDRKGVDIWRCLLKPSIGGSSRKAHQREIRCYNTSNMKQHLGTWHLPALNLIQSLVGEGTHSSSSVESQIFDKFGESNMMITGNNSKYPASFENLLGEDNALVHQKKLRYACTILSSLSFSSLVCVCACFFFGIF